MSPCSAAQAFDRPPSSDHWRLAKVPMKRLTAAFVEKLARCAAGTPPSGPGISKISECFTARHAAFTLGPEIVRVCVFSGIFVVVYSFCGGSFLTFPAAVSGPTWTLGTGVGKVRARKFARASEIAAVKGFIGTHSPSSCPLCSGSARLATRRAPGQGSPRF